MIYNIDYKVYNKIWLFDFILFIPRNDKINFIKLKNQIWLNDLILFLPRNDKINFIKLKNQI